MTPRPSLAGRAAAAVALMVGFYVLALAVVAVLFWIPYAEYRYAHRLHLQLLAGCVLAGLAIVVAVFPRRDRFEAPGPRLTPKTDPELFRLIEEVAKATGQAMPREVYLVPEVNAFVSQRGGWIGLGSRRVMGIGLPLLQALTVSELRAVLAHEFGHYHHGDTALGPWIYTTRAALVRTLVSLQESVVQGAFVWYWKAFLRTTHGISRAQEFAADALAARAAGGAALASGLKKSAAAAAAQAAFLQQELAPVLMAGRRPPLVEGFAQYLAAPRVRKSLDEFVATELKSARDDPYDTHPPLPRRLEALASAPSAAPAADDRPALTLIVDAPALEAELVEVLTGGRVDASVAPIAWSDVGVVVRLPRWRETVAEVAKYLKGVTPATLPADEAALTVVGRCVQPVSTREEAAAIGTQAIGIALAVLLARRGFALRYDPGDGATFTKDGVSIDPFAAATEAIGAGRAAWIERARAAGIADADLGTVTPL